jgi:ABC-type uncharacterized transport system permease subunit
VRRIVGQALLAAGFTAAVGGLVWIIWLPVFGDFREFSLPLAVGWTGCIVAALGTWIEP